MVYPKVLFPPNISIKGEKSLSGKPLCQASCEARKEAHSDGAEDFLQVF